MLKFHSIKLLCISWSSLLKEVLALAAGRTSQHDHKGGQGTVVIFTLRYASHTAVTFNMIQSTQANVNHQVCVAILSYEEIKMVLKMVLLIFDLVVNTRTDPWNSQIQLENTELDGMNTPCI